MASLSQLKPTTDFTILAVISLSHRASCLASMSTVSPGPKVQKHLHFSFTNYCCVGILSASKAFLRAQAVQLWVTILLMMRSKLSRMLLKTLFLLDTQCTQISCLDTHFVCFLFISQRRFSMLRRRRICRNQIPFLTGRVLWSALCVYNNLDHAVQRIWITWGVSHLKI